MHNMLKKAFSLGLRALRLGGREVKDEARKTEKFFAGELKNELKKVSGAAMRVAGRADKSMHDKFKKCTSKSKKKNKR